MVAILRTMLAAMLVLGGATHATARVAAPTQAPTASPAPQPTPTPTPGHFVTADFARWADDTFRAAYADHAFSGMAIVVVENGKPTWMQTYGAARQQPAVPIDPKRTRLLIGSISKTFVGLAVAQLVERGVIRSIDDPANRYLKRYRFKGAMGDKVRIRDLLTHSAGIGFTGRNVGTDHVVPTPLDPAEIDRIVPDLVRAPGRLVVYSNVATGILGIMIEDLTGQPIGDYYRQNIWAPMGLASARFHTALTNDDSDTVRAERWKDGRYEPKPFIAFHPFYYPVGAISITLEDAARYAAFHLNGAMGRPNGVLSPATLSRVQQRIFASHPLVGGFGFQTMNFPWGSHRVIGHGGTWPGYESMLMVLPDRDVAIFYSIVGPADLTNLKANDLILRQIYGPSAAPAPVRAMTPAQLAEFQGTYLPAMRAQEGAEQFFTYLVGGAAKVTAVADGLMIGDDGPFRPVGQDSFWNPDAKFTGANPFGAALFAFTRDADGRVVQLVHQQGMTPYDRVSDRDDPKFWSGIVGYLGYALLIGLAAVAWRARGRFDRVAKAAAIIVGPATVAIFPSLVVGMGSRGLEAYFIEGQKGRFLAAMTLANLAALCGIVVAIAAIRWLREGAERPLWMRIHAGIIGILGVALAITLAGMGLLGWLAA
jgi:CubicO group peptidase (beta-lactamase class C family)